MNNMLTIGLGGDVMIGRGVDKMIALEGYLYPWGNMLPMLSSTDINIVNLETTLTTGNRKVGKAFNFKSRPENVNTLMAAHITAVNLANNHILDFSEEGLIETIRTLEKAHIHYAGAGMNEQEAAKAAIITCKDIHVGMLGFTDNEPGWKAGPGYGINYIDIDNSCDRLKALRAIEQLAQETEFIVVSIHWGPNMKEKPAPSFTAFAHDMIEAGADLIHGHSAHIFQGIEVYRNKLILYDTGDFVDDYRVDIFQRNDHSFFFIARVGNKSIYHLQMVPVLISNCQVNLAMKSNSQWPIRRMQELSAALGTGVNDAREICFNELSTHSFTCSFGA